MKIEKKEIGEEMKRLLSKGYDSEKISDWAERLLITLEEKSEVYFVLNRLSLMEAGPEFEYTVEELNSLAELFINNIEDPFQQIDNIKFKQSD
jgi:hypothetical protein